MVIEPRKIEIYAPKIGIQLGKMRIEIRKNKNFVNKKIVISSTQMVI